MIDMKTRHDISRFFASALILGALCLGGTAIVLAPSSAGIAQAAATSNYVLLEPLPGVSTDTSTACAGGSTSASCQTDFLTYLGGILKLAIAAAGVLAVVMITFGGFEYIMSASVGGKSNAKEIIQNALVGLFLALASYLILYTVNPSLTILKFQLPNNSGNSATLTPGP